ncbi:MAG: hypothetical protein ACRELV_05490 [Longimicrobiales bacterium]
MKGTASVILHCEFEELRALTSGLEGTLSEYEGGGVAAPPEVVADIEALLPRLTGDLSVASYVEQQSLERALDFVLDRLRERMDVAVLSEYVGSERAVLAYFDYGHVLTIFDRVQSMGEEMFALIELMTGEPPNRDTAGSITFPD